MPIYEYRCSSCGHELEALQKLSDAPLTVCPACNKAELKKLVSAAGFQLKGSGWYVTDFRNSGGKPGAKTAPAKDGAQATGGEATTETKSDAKTGEGSASETKAATPASDSSASTAAPAPTAASSTGKTGS